MLRGSHRHTDRSGDRSHAPAGTRRTRHGHGSIPCATAAAIAAAVVGLGGCHTPPQSPAPVYGGTVPPPSTGMIGQPAPYGYAAAPVTTIPPTAPTTPMPGPATSWQGMPQPAAAPANSWTWSAPAGTAPPPAAANYQQYGTQLGNQMTAQANQLQQGVAAQTQQYGNQLQGQAQQYANQTGQALTAQQQQLANQLQNSANQFQQGINGQAQQFNNQLQQGVQSAQQQFNGQLQQAMPQMPSVPQQQTANGSWWPFSSPQGMPPARSIPVQPARY